MSHVNRAVERRPQRYSLSPRCWRLVNPLATIIVAAVFAWRHGFSVTAPWLFGIAFLPAALVVYNETALPFALVYVAAGYLGEGVGLGLKRLLAALRNRSDAPGTPR